MMAKRPKGRKGPKVSAESKWLGYIRIRESGGRKSPVTGLETFRVGRGQGMPARRTL